MRNTIYLAVVVSRSNIIEAYDRVFGNKETTGIGRLGSEGSAPRHEAVRYLSLVAWDG